MQFPKAQLSRLTAVILSGMASVGLHSCNAFEEPDTGISIRMNVEHPGNIAAVNNPMALTANSPFHVVAFSQDKACSSFYFLFEADAYMNSNHTTSWVGGTRCWPGELTKFVAYWPADANVKFDSNGNVMEADCILIAITGSVNHFSENVTLTFKEY